jgi:hypothetical protein
MMFRKRYQFPFDKYTIDPAEYQKERLVHNSQPPLVLRELRAAKFCMAVFIPFFSLLSFRLFPAALITGIISAGVSFRLLRKRVSLKAAAAAAASVALGIVFGRTLLFELWTYIHALTGGTI